MHTWLPIWQSKTISSRKIEKTAVIERKKKRVTTTFEESIQRHQQQGILAACGTVDFDSSYDYKADYDHKAERAAFGHPRSIAIPQNSNRLAPFCGRFSRGT
jgi:hypothetical protein